MKILICDDDISTVNMIQSQVDWGKLGIHQVLTAYNGSVAKELIEQEQPELILCDIEMPQEDGIGVLRFVHDRGISCEFAFLTCFESFEYAREAVRYGAVNYLTKPVDLGQLLEALEQMAAAAKENNWEEWAGRRKQIESENRILEQLCGGMYGTGPKRLAEAIRRERLSLAADGMWHIVCVCAEITHADPVKWEPGILQFTLRALAQEAVAGRLDQAHLLTEPGERFCFVTLFIEAERYTASQLEHRCRNMIHVSRENIGIAPVCLIGGPVKLYEVPGLMPDMRRERERLRLNEGKVFFLHDAKRLQGQEGAGKLQVLPDELEVLRCLQTRDLAGYLGLVGDCTEEIASGGYASDQSMALLHQELLQIFYRCMQDNHIQRKELFEDAVFHSVNQNAERSIFDLMQFASWLFEWTAERMEQSREQKDPVGQVKRYIKEHFRENINRDELAAAVWLTPNYLSRLFHRELGTSLRDYINQLRIEEAKRLLMTTQMPVGDIAMETGFESISYFSTVFRKLTGMTPQEWRRQTEQQ